MHSNRYLSNIILLAGLAVLLSACAPAAAPSTATLPAPASPTAVQPSEAVPYSDPFSYCAAVGTIDQPDARYTGEKVPDAVIQGFIKAADLTNSTMPSDLFKQMTIWRCMDHKVYACNFGANLPCDSKANTDKTPTQGMTDFCKENPNADFIPMSVTGHDTIYSWHCVKDTPEMLDQIDQVDAAGYLTRIWYALEPVK